jgi:NADPH-dependent 2,4-dienoyl-CoA reductase/sulfur reductase-like enzyme
LRLWPNIFRNKNLDAQAVIQRRRLIQTAALGSAAAVLGLNASAAPIHSKAPKVVIIGGGFGGATAAKYLRIWSGGRIEVILIEPMAELVSCPMSNLVVGGTLNMSDISVSYDSLRVRYGIQIIRDVVSNIQIERRKVILSSGDALPYDKLIVSPGIELMTDALPGWSTPDAQESVLHAWKAGPQTLNLRKQLEAMSDGGVFAISIPLAPYRCPPGPYERACLVAQYFQQVKPKSKVLILDENEDVTSKGPLFKKAWTQLYRGMVEYRPNQKVVDLDAATRTLKLEFDDDLQADVLNVLPPMRAGSIAVRAGLATANQRWCEVNFLTFESKVAPHVHVLGDAIQIAPLMPKSGHMANQHGKTCAAAIVAMLLGQEVNATPIYNNTCYSFVNATQAVHVASVHRYDAREKTMLPVKGAGGLSSQASDLEATYAMAWAQNIWADMLS